MKSINVLFLFLFSIAAAYSSPTMAIAMTEPHASAKQTFEFGIRYWRSSGNVNFKLMFIGPKYGDPTSTIDWEDLVGSSVEGFFRYDYRSGLYIKGLAGIGKTISGVMTDRDFYAGQSKFSDTSSKMVYGKMMYASADVGFAYHSATGSRLGVFVGEQIWRDKLTKTGLVDNMPGKGNQTDYFSRYDDVPTMIYEPNWYFLRLGVDGKLATHKWSLEGEAVLIPIAILINYDSHLLRTNPKDLGPAPNVNSISISGRGFQLEGFVNYALTSKNEIGFGVRYWRLSANNGLVNANGLGLLTEFSETRFGALVQFKHKF